MNSDNIMSGSLTVSGSDEVDIVLFGKPVSISVEFIDDGGNIPCDPHQDIVDYKINFQDSSFVLKIIWNVSGVREISWVVDFTE